MYESFLFFKTGEYFFITYKLDKPRMSYRVVIYIIVYINSDKGLSQCMFRAGTPLVVIVQLYTNLILSVISTFRENSSRPTVCTM